VKNFIQPLTHLFSNHSG